MSVALRRRDDPPHGTRSAYQAACRCLPCRSANAAYQAALRRQQARGIQPLGQHVSAREMWKQIKSLQIEGFSLAEIARRLGLPCMRLQLHHDRVTRRNFLKVRALYRQIMLEGPEA